MMRVIRLTDKQKKILAYGAYAVVMAAIFAWLLFPNRAVCDLVEKNAGRVHPDLAVRVADAGPGFPPGLVLRNVSVYFRDQHYGDFRYVRISPSFLSLLGAGRSFAFKARIMDGGVKGVCRQDKTTGKWAIDMAFSNVGLEAMAFLNQLPVRQITGTADGTINGDLDGRQTSVRADLVLSGVAVTLKEPVLSLDAVTFDRVETAVTVNGDRLRIERLTGKGKQMEGDLAGDILVRRPFAQSSLRLKGNIKPQAGLTAALGKSSSVDVLLSHVGEQGFPIELKGTLAAPGFSLK